MDENRKMMQQQIKNRLDDDSWDLMTAGAVLKKRRRSRMRVISGVSLSSLAAAASVFIIMSAVLNTTEQTLRYNAFISDQISGTYHSVFVSNQVKANHTPEDDILSMQSIDSTIDEALALR